MKFAYSLKQKQQAVRRERYRDDSSGHQMATCVSVCSQHATIKPLGPIDPRKASAVSFTRGETRIWQASLLLSCSVGVLSLVPVSLHVV